MTIRTQAQLIEAAKSAGLKVTTQDGRTDIVRDKNHMLRIHADKVMLRLDISCCLASRLNIKDAAALLQLS